MEGENRTPDKPIGEIQHAEEQTKRITGHLPPHGPGALEDDVKAKAKQNSEAKKREF